MHFHSTHTTSPIPNIKFHRHFTRFPPKLILIPKTSRLTTPTVSSPPTISKTPSHSTNSLSASGCAPTRPGRRTPGHDEPRGRLRRHPRVILDWGQDVLEVGAGDVAWGRVVRHHDYLSRPGTGLAHTAVSGVDPHHLREMACGKVTT